MNQHPTLLSYAEELDRISEILNKEKRVTKRFKLLTTYCQVLDNPITRLAISKSDFPQAMDYIDRFTPKTPVPRHYEILAKLGLTISETSQYVRIVNKENQKLVKEIKNDDICSGSEALKLALVAFASECDGVAYSVDFTKENREVLFTEHTRVNKIDLTYQEYVDWAMEKKDNGLEIVSVRDDDMEIVADHLTKDSCTSEVLSEEEAIAVLETIREKNLIFQCKMKASATIEFPGFKIDKMENAVRRFTPMREMVFARGPEHQDFVLELITLLKKVNRPEGKIFDYKPNVGKNMMMARKVQASATNIDFTKADDNSNKATSSIIEIIGTNKRLMTKYAELKETFETHRELIQAQDIFRTYLTSFQGSPAWKKKITELKQHCGGQSFDQLVLAGARELKDHLGGVAYGQACISKGQAVISMSIAECLDAFMDSLIKSPAQFPEMMRTSRGYRFIAQSQETANRKKFNPAKDPLQRNIDSKVLDEFGQSRYNSLEEMRDILCSPKEECQDDISEESEHNSEEEIGEEGSENEENL